MKTCIVIPARAESSRLPNKLLLDKTGKTVLEHTYLAACQSELADWIVIACGDEDTWKVAKKIEDDANAGLLVAFMTDPTHTCGTDRVAQIATFRELQDYELFVNLQGDEPLMPAKYIDTLITHARHDIQLGPDYMATLAVPLVGERAVACLEDRSETKVVFDNNKWAMYFSRAPIPDGPPVQGATSLEEFTSQLEAATCYHHIGIYIYDRGRLNAWPLYHRGQWEQVEGLEQLRGLEYGGLGNVRVHLVDEDVRGINTQEDYDYFVEKVG
jgi:3-deoxy-manno-octulosonate cytidylyltransferase (CMP-KDO synthetase)